MKLEATEKGAVVQIGRDRYEVVGHGSMGSRVQKLQQLKSGAWGKRNIITFSSQTECEAIPTKDSTGVTWGHAYGDGIADD
jgi:hypothetical protein